MRNFVCNICLMSPVLLKLKKHTHKVKGLCLKCKMSNLFSPSRIFFFHKLKLLLFSKFCQSRYFDQTGIFNTTFTKTNQCAPSFVTTWSNAQSWPTGQSRDILAQVMTTIFKFKVSCKVHLCKFFFVTDSASQFNSISPFLILFCML